MSGLEREKEYAFQYVVDGTIYIADPYADKVLDPWNDSYIPSTVYPDLKPYPTGKAEGIVSVLQTGQTPYQWQVTDFKKPDRNQLMVYEMHIRDFTSEHSFNAAKDKLPYLKQLGINAIELMPVNEFEGNSSWGYNPSFYFAVDKYYGTKNDMRAFVDECHRQGIAVIIDLVLNHSLGSLHSICSIVRRMGLRRQIIPGIIKSLIFLMLLCSGDMILIIKVRIPVRWWTVWPVSG